MQPSPSSFTILMLSDPQGSPKGFQAGSLARLQSPQLSPTPALRWAQPGAGPSPWTPSVFLAQGLYPESVSYVLGTRGHNVTLHLRKNR